MKSQSLYEELIFYIFFYLPLQTTKETAQESELYMPLIALTIIQM
jgi:hypothetical protein